jgi:ectoine hydroxylase-related dioxygenase (phytanoyl-CoA dioxygenase family)
MPVFSEEQLDFWNKNGYIVLHNAVPQSYLDAVVDATWEFLDMKRDDPSGWYHWPGWHRPRSGMVQMFHHQSMWDVRQYPRIHQAFSEIYGTEKLWVSLDRLNMNPPALPEDDWEGVIHWDIDPSTHPSPLRVGGVLCLTDTSEEQGGFQCVPGTHLRVEEIAAAIPEGRNPRTPIVDPKDIQSVPGKAGDLIIWNNWLLHSNSRNRTHKPRLAQYVTMTPASYHTEEEREFRINAWKGNLVPFNQNEYGEDPRGIEKAKPTYASLTELGKKLLGEVAW